MTTRGKHRTSAWTCMAGTIVHPRRFNPVTSLSPDQPLPQGGLLIFLFGEAYHGVIMPQEPPCRAAIPSQKIPPQDRIVEIDPLRVGGHWIHPSHDLRRRDSALQQQGGFLPKPVGSPQPGKV